MKKLVMLMALSLFVFATACAEDQSKPAPKDSDTKQTSEKKDTCPEDCDKPCCKKDAKVSAKCPEDCKKDCCAETVVTVNGVKIANKVIVAEVDKRLAAQAKRMPPNAEMPDFMKQQVRAQVVDLEVEKVLLNEELKKRKLKVTDDQVLDKIKVLAAKRDQTLEDVEKEIVRYGMTMDDLKGQVRFQIEIKTLMEAETPDSKVTEADAKKYYDETPQRFEQPEQVTTSHILCGKRGITDEEFAAELEKIKKVQERLKAGEEFEDLAKECSTCPSGKEGGALPPFGRQSGYDPAYKEASFNLNVGETSDIVKSSFGYHIIKVTDKKEAEKISFDEAKDDIVQFLEQNKVREFWPGFKEKMLGEAKIEYSEKEKAAQEAAQKAMEAARQSMPKPTMSPAPAKASPKGKTVPVKIEKPAEK